MAFELPPLPYDTNALAGAGMCQETLELHHGKHHQAYVTALNGFVEKDSALQGKSLDEIVKQTAATPGPVFNNAGQHWNHILFWKNLSPTGGKIPGKLSAKIDSDLGGVEKFKEAFKAAATTQFGSGWAWLMHGHATASWPLPRRRTAAIRLPPARARCCSPSMCGSTATTWISATAVRITRRTTWTSWPITNSPKPSCRRRERAG